MSSQKEQLIAKVVADIKSKTAANSITPTILGEVIVDVVEAAMTPQRAPGEATEIYTLDGKPVFRKLIIVDDGSELDQVDLSIPENTALISASMVKEKKVSKGYTISIGTNDFDQTSGVPVIIFKGANNELKINDIDLVSADLAFHYIGSNGTMVVNETYQQGQDITASVPKIRGFSRLDKILISNIVGGTFENGANLKYEFSINSSNYTKNFLIDFGALPDELYKYSAFPSAANPQQFTTETFNIAIKTKAFEIRQVSIFKGNKFFTFNEGTLNLRFMFADDSTEEISIVDGEVIVLNKDFSGLNSPSSLEVEILPTSLINDDTGNPFDINGFPATPPVEFNLTQFFNNNQALSADELDLSLRGDLEQGFQKNEWYSIPTPLQNEPDYRNIYITLEWV